MSEGWGSIGGMPVIVTYSATEEWKPPMPRTDDMRAMVDEFWRRGLILPRRVPAALKMDGKLIVHPSLYVKLAMRQAGIVDTGRYLA